MDCELRSHGEYGWECQTFLNSEFYYGRRFPVHGAALEEADVRRGELEECGWIAIV